VTKEKSFHAPTADQHDLRFDNSLHNGSGFFAVVLVPIHRDVSLLE
jgi:hypothetical protein